MALRTIRTEGDSVLEKVCRPVEKIDKRTKDLVGDMLETMYDACGVGLAAPQVGILKRIVVIDIGDGPLVLINPEILMTSGEQTGEEGCLSVPGMSGQVFPILPGSAPQPVSGGGSAPLVLYGGCLLHLQLHFCTPHLNPQK